MNNQKIIQWEKDIKYYDPKNIELKKLLKIENFRGKKVLDVGCGIGRLTLPISRYAKEVTALDIDRDIINYCKKYKNKKNVKYILSDVRKFNENNFDIVIFAQPFYENFQEILRSIKKCLKKKGKLIILRWVDRGNDYTRILSFFWNKDKELMKKVDIFSKNFIKKIKKYLKLNKILLVRTYYKFPNRKEFIKNFTQDIPEKVRNEELLSKLSKRYNCKKINIILKIYLCEKNDI